MAFGQAFTLEEEANFNLKVSQLIANLSTPVEGFESIEAAESWAKEGMDTFNQLEAIIDEAFDVAFENALDCDVIELPGYKTIHKAQMAIWDATLNLRFRISKARQQYQPIPFDQYFDLSNGNQPEGELCVINQGPKPQPPSPAAIALPLPEAA